MSNQEGPPEQRDDENYEEHYLLNDALCPRPISGPRVTVGFWADDNVEEGNRPVLTSEPFFTITYPVGGCGCYNWYHFTDDPDEEPHPNSATDINWTNGQLNILQSTEFGCRPNLGRVENPPKEKPMFWEIFRDFPTYLWARIVETHEILEITIRERCVLQFYAADGHYIRYSSEDNHDIVCDKRVLDDNCKFTARFPDYKWDHEGGSGDSGAFYLVADNGHYIRRRNSGMLCADVSESEKEERAMLFTATLASGSAISLAAQGETLQHAPPYGKLEMVDNAQASPIWAWFTVSYGIITAQGLSVWD